LFFDFGKDLVTEKGGFEKNRGSDCLFDQNLSFLQKSPLQRVFGVI